MDIGQTIKTARQSKGLSLRDLEAISGVRNGYISKIEQNMYAPTTTLLTKLLEPLGYELTIKKKRTRK